MTPLITALVGIALVGVNPALGSVLLIAGIIGMVVSA
jgi:hypothetical protein